MLDAVNEWLKAAVLEVQEYVRLCVAAFRGVFSRPFYFRDLVEQIDVIGLGSLTVVLLTGFFTGAVLALQSGMTLDQFGARPFVGSMRTRSGRTATRSSSPVLVPAPTGTTSRSRSLTRMTASPSATSSTRRSKAFSEPTKSATKGVCGCS